MSEDMSDMMQKLSGMLAGKEVPDNIKSMLQNFTANKSSESTSSTTSPEEEAHTTDSSNESGNTETSNPFGNIDIGTIMKMKSIMDLICYFP